MKGSTRFAAIVAVAASISLGLCGPTRAWGPEGHDIVAKAAYALLSKKAQQHFDAILKAGGGIKDQYDDKGQTQNCQANTITQLANWSDCVRYGGPYAYTYENHFDDIPLCPKPGAKKADYCNDMKQCASMTLPQWIAKLKAAGTSDHDRAVALAMVVHIVGDLHQPLHASNNNDTGGNSVTVSVTPPGANPKTYSTKLHKAWDGDVVKAVFPSEANGVQTITTAAKAILNSSDAKSTDFDAWATGTHSYAVGAYGKLTPPITCKSGEAGAHAINPDYFTNFSNDTVSKQLALAAARLANVLSGAL
jgi:hypothetical protein